MIQWTLDALSHSRRVASVVVVGLEDHAGLIFSRRIRWLPNNGSMMENILAGAAAARELAPDADRLLVLSSDNPAADGHMLDWVIEQAAEGNEEFCYCVIDRRDMEAAFPGNRRTYLRFADREVCGGDLAIIKSSIFRGERGTWERLMEARKSPVRMALAIGLDVLVLFLLHRLTLDDAAHRAGRRLSLTGRVVPCPYPEIGMDVDKPHQLDLVQAALLRRGRQRPQRQPRKHRGSRTGGQRRKPQPS